MRASRVPSVPFLACVAALALRATCVAAGGSADDLARATREALAEAFASKATKLSSPPRFHGAEVTVYPPRSLADPRRGGHEGNDGTKYPVVVFLHGFCLPDENQQKYNFTATRAGAGVGGTPRRQTLTQIGLRDFVDDAFYVTPTSPTTTRQCALCNLGDDSPNVADRLTTSWINNTLARIAPAFVCNTWDGSDACCAPEKGGEGDDVAFIADVIRAVVDGEHKSFVDENRVYLVGIATGGFMANRFACERPDLIAGVMTFAGGVWNDAAKCAGSEIDDVAILQIHGDADTTVPLEGGTNFAGVPFPSAERTFSILADAFRCDEESNDIRAESFALPAAKDSPLGPVAVDVRRRNGCGAGGGTVERWTLRGVDHFWEEETGRAMFEQATKWLFPFRKKNTSSE
jgi:poly(3-hydroxybutyrate) depolymerase